MTDERKRQAHAVVATAVQVGLLVPNSSCERCGHVPEPGEQRLDAHHYLGYGLYHVLLVQWLCHGCHTAVHLSEVDEDGQTEGQRRAAKGWETRRARYGPTGLSDTPRVNAKQR